jgi:SulP family sulfate permease
MVVPLQYAVLVGVALSIVLHTARQSFQVAVKRWMVLPDGDIMEAAPPATLPPDDVVVLQPYGSLFFAAVPMLEAALPEPAQSSRNSVVILRLGGQTDLGATLLEALRRYALALQAVDSKLVLVHAGEKARRQLDATGLTSVVGADNIYAHEERIGAAVRRAYGDSVAWVAARRDDEGHAG